MDQEQQGAAAQDQGDSAVSGEHAEHVHGPGCGHNHQEEPEPELVDFEANVLEVAYAMQARFGERTPTPEEEKDFMREWLIGKGRTPEEAEAIINS